MWECRRRRTHTLLIDFAFAFPLPALGASVHISLTFSRTILQCLSKALTRPRSLRLFLQLMSTWDTRSVRGGRV